MFLPGIFSGITDIPITLFYNKCKGDAAAKKRLHEGALFFENDLPECHFIHRKCFFDFKLILRGFLRIYLLFRDPSRNLWCLTLLAYPFANHSLQACGHCPWEVMGGGSKVTARFHIRKFFSKRLLRALRICKMYILGRLYLQDVSCIFGPLRALNFSINFTFWVGGVENQFPCRKLYV